MTGLYPWIVVLHVLAAFGFVGAHGVSTFVAFALRGAPDRARAASLLGLSAAAVNAMYASLLVLLAAGVAAGFIGGHWGRLWIWSALVLLVLVTGAMYGIATPYYISVRRALGLPHQGRPAGEPQPEAEVAQLLRSSRPTWLALIGGIGLAVIIALMELKPF